MLSLFAYLREPLWLLLALLPTLLILLATLLKKRRSHSYADPVFNDWVLSAHTQEHQHRFRQLLFTQLAWLAFAIAIAGPRLPEKIYDSQQQYQQEVMVVIDVSQSMSARDLTPSRLERARLELLDLVERMDNTRLGVVVYAGRPHLLTPPTTDKQVLKFYLKSLRTALLPTEGSDLFAALQYTVQYLANQSNQQQTTPRAIVLVSDGEVNLTATETSAALKSLTAKLKQHDIRLFSLGTGTLQGAALLSEHSGWLEHDGQAIVSKLNQELLTRLAYTGNGRYAPVSDDDADWVELYNNGIARTGYQSADKDLDKQILWQEQYHWFVITGTIFLLLGLWLPSSRSASALTSTMILATLSVSLSFSDPAPVYAAPEKNQNNEYQSDEYRQAYQSFQQGDYQAAREAFAGIPGYAGRFAEGSMAYQREQYPQAIAAFIQAILDANNDQQRISAIFNLANCYFKLEKYGQAAQLYRDVLRYQADFKPAKINLEYAVALKKTTVAEPDIMAGRQGKGPRLADAPENMDITTGKVSLGDSESKSEDSDRTVLAPVQPAKPVDALEHSAPASEKVEQIKDESWTYDISSLSQLQQRNPKIQTDESVLWQRLFEVEEDFEAPQDKPAALPGVKPW